MPVALLEGCTTSSGCTTRTLCSFPPPSLPCQSSTTDSQSLQPANPTGQSLCSHHPSSCSHGLTGLFRQTKHFSQAAKVSSIHCICSSAFLLAVMVRFPDSPCTEILNDISLTPTLIWLPCLAPPDLKSSSAFCPPLLAAATWSPLHGPCDSTQQQSNAISVSVIADFPLLSTTSPQTLPWFIPLPEEPVMRVWQCPACQDPSQPSAIHWGTFTAPLAVPSQQHRQRHGGVLRTSTKARGND